MKNTVKFGSNKALTFQREGLLGSVTIKAGFMAFSEHLDAPTLQEISEAAAALAREVEAANTAGVAR